MKCNQCFNAGVTKCIGCVRHPSSDDPEQFKGNKFGTALWEPYLQVMLLAPLLRVLHARLRTPCEAQRRDQSCVNVMKAAVQSAGRRAAVVLQEDLNTKTVIKDAEKKLKKSLASVTEQLSTIRVGRATSDMLDRVQVKHQPSYEHTMVQDTDTAQARHGQCASNTRGGRLHVAAFTNRTHRALRAVVTTDFM
eukprot:6177022-Pleurochrysis_carterae.AAC.2